MVFCGSISVLEGSFLLVSQLLGVAVLAYWYILLQSLAIKNMNYFVFFSAMVSFVVVPINDKSLQRAFCIYTRSWFASFSLHGFTWF